MGEKADTSSRSGKPRRESPSPTSGPIDDGPPRERVLTITELEQLKVLADPLRSRILERFAERARTTKQVAASLGEPPTKLYHHVDALERAGLIELVATRQNRGTLEKHYRAVARTFRADPELLPGSVPAGDLAHLGADLPEQTARELRRAGSRREPEAPDGPPGRPATPTVVRAEIRATAADIEELEERLERFVEELGIGADAQPDEDGELGDERYRLVIAFFPVED